MINNMIKTIKNPIKSYIIIKRLLIRIPVILDFSRNSNNFTHKQTKIITPHYKIPLKF